MALSNCVRMARPEARPIAVSRCSVVCVRAVAGGVPTPDKKTIVGKGKLVESIVKDADLTPAQAAKAYEAFLQTMQSALVNGDRVTLPGFGSLEVRDRSARSARNPRTGEPMTIEACKTAAFKPAAALKDAVNGRAAPKAEKPAAPAAPAKPKATKPAATKPASPAPKAPAAKKPAAAKPKKSA
ncbi:hypothetical protein Agub_g6012 [Astrephomene gubernaculifera]|uniref:Uncharacterized protein n=1 Tax=Astrephomene gubernaculifera TaxID=47775 RepID=A0AAD3DS55_9CHLO|nr:hypothetical protein Agub_g6012 [Astrephomene gubernaculifera]